MGDQLESRFYLYGGKRTLKWITYQHRLL